MATSIEAPAPVGMATKRPVWLGILAALYFLLGVVTFLPQLYYVFYYAGLVTASPHANVLGQVWYWYGTTVDTSALSKDSGTMAGALEDAFLLGPLYLATGVGLWLRSGWVRAVGFITAGGGFYAIMYFILTYTLDHAASVMAVLTFWVTLIPYVALPVWLTVALLTRRTLFTPSTT